MNYKFLFEKLFINYKGPVLLYKTNINYKWNAMERKMPWNCFSYTTLLTKYFISWRNPRIFRKDILIKERRADQPESVTWPWSSRGSHRKMERSPIPYLLSPIP